MENVETVQVTLNVPKECKEVIDALTDIVALVRKKAETAEYLALIPSLSKAVDGYDQIGAEAKSQYRGDLIGYFAKQANDAF